jgi:pimeloyl-ACP methyl ester carboxylesterase
MPPPRLILLPGLAANERLYRRLLPLLPHVEIPRWIPPLRNESLPAYARRFASTLQSSEPTVVGGASFGGLVALEMAETLRSPLCLLINAVRTPAEFPPRFRLARPLGHLSPRALALAAATACPSARLLPPGSRADLRRLAAPHEHFRRWATLAALRWTPTYPTSLRIHQLHGRRDRTFPVRLTSPNVIIPTGGHLLPLTHPHEVANFITCALQDPTSF